MTAALCHSVPIIAKVRVQLLLRLLHSTLPSSNANQRKRKWRSRILYRAPKKPFDVVVVVCFYVC
jgi:hypothetical protein